MILINIDKLINVQIYDNAAASHHNGHGWINNLYSAAGRRSNYTDRTNIDKVAADDSSVSALVGGFTTRVLRGTTGGSNGDQAIFGTGANGTGMTGNVQKINLATDAEVTLTNNWSGFNRYFRSSVATKEAIVFNGGESSGDNTTASNTRFLKFDDSTSHRGLASNLQARSRANACSNGLDALVTGGVSMGPDTPFGTTIERFRPDAAAADAVFTTIFNNNVNFDVKNGTAVSSGKDYILFNGRYVTANALSTTHSKIPFDDTAITDIPIPTGGTNTMVGGGVMSGDAYYSLGGYTQSGAVVRYKDSDPASAITFTNSMIDRQLHASFGGY